MSDNIVELATVSLGSFVDDGIQVEARFKINLIQNTEGEKTIELNQVSPPAKEDMDPIVIALSLSSGYRGGIQLQIFGRTDGEFSEHNLWLG